MTPTIAVLIVLVTVVGSAAQRMAGLGFALLVSPIMTLMLGGHTGVLLVNILGVVSSALIVPRVWRLVDWSLFRWLSGFAIVGAVTGSWLATRLSADVMAVGVGAIVLMALGLSVVFTSDKFTTEPRGPRVITGLLSGLTNALAGVGGPAVSAYAVLTRWPQASFAATLQPYFVVTGIAATAAKLTLEPATLPETHWAYWLVILVAILVGIWIGEKLLPRIAPGTVRRFVIVLAAAGAAASLVRGIVGLVS